MAKEVAQFEKALPNLHKLVSRYSSADEIDRPKLIIRGLGRMQVLLGEKTITNADWQTKAVRDLFFYMLSHPEGSTKEEIGEVFWPEANRETVKLRFKNTIYRLRRAVGNDTISFENEIYKFNQSIDYDYDVEMFKKELALAGKTSHEEEKAAHLQAAIAHYHGELLPKLDQDWVTIEREKLRQTFIDAVITLMDLNMETGHYEQAIELSDLALKQDPCDEEIHRTAMLVYSALNDRRSLVRQYDRCKSALQKELNLEPSPQTVKLYQSLINQ